ncbi:MAG: YqgE/AlgH family protein [Ilumatobacteraceae bacterium]
MADPADRGRAHQRLLVASPLMEDRNFRRSVVAVLDHGTDGAFGLVLTRPIASLDPAQIDRAGDTGRRIAGWLDGASEPQRVFEGGPVQPAALMALATVRDAERPWVSRVGQSTARDGAGLELVSVDLSADPTLAGECERLRVYRGYAGWGPGQLDGELEMEGWILAESLAGRDFDDVFCASPTTLWRDVIARQPGATSWLRDYPADPTRN